MPELSRFYGIIIRMYFDDHAPPHFHAEYGGEQAVVGIEALAVPRNMEGAQDLWERDKYDFALERGISCPPRVSLSERPVSSAHLGAPRSPSVSVTGGWVGSGPGRGMSHLDYKPRGREATQNPIFHALYTGLPATQMRRHDSCGAAILVTICGCQQ